MKLAAMQPYFFPYIGYWQLMNIVDKYIIWDDGLFRPLGWINRNRILVNNSPYYITLPVYRSPNIRIYDMKIGMDERLKRKLLMTIKYNYARAPYFKECYSMIEAVILNKEDNLSRFVMNSIQIIRTYLGIDTSIILSSKIDKDMSTSAQQKLIYLCHLYGADTYINAIGGTSLYSTEEFKKEGIQLKFIKTDEISYKQFGDEFVPNLSIIDVIMFCGRDGTRELLDKYELIEK